MTRITLIIDKSQSYLDFQKSEVLKEWSDIEEVQYVTDISSVGQLSLFGDTPASVIQLKDIDAVKKTLAALEQEEKNNTLAKKTQSGIILLTTVARVSTKKLEALIERNNGQVVLAKTSAKDKTNVSSKLLSELNLKTDVRNFLIEYAGDDYDNIISAAKALSTLSKTAQNKITIEDMYLRMPQSPGSVPPWEIERPLMAGNVEETIKSYRRITQNAHLLVILSILKNKITLSYRIAAVMSNNPSYSADNVAKALNVANNYPFKLSSQVAQKHGLKKMEWILMELLETEAKVKGGSSTDDNVTMELSLAKIANRM